MGKCTCAVNLTSNMIGTVSYKFHDEALTYLMTLRQLPPLVAQITLHPNIVCFCQPLCPWEHETGQRANIRNPIYKKYICTQRPILWKVLACQETIVAAYLHAAHNIMVWYYEDECTSFTYIKKVYMIDDTGQEKHVNIAVTPKPTNPTLRQDFTMTYVKDIQ